MTMTEADLPSMKGRITLSPTQRELLGRLSPGVEYTAKELGAREPTLDAMAGKGALQTHQRSSSGLAGYTITYSLPT